MRNFLTDAPPMLWAVIITGLTLLSVWATEYFGAVAWIPVAVSLVTSVIVPLLRLLAPPDVPVAGGRALEELPPQPSKFKRWLV